MKSAKNSLAAIVAILVCPGCMPMGFVNNALQGSGVLIEQTREVPDVTGLEVSGAFKVTIACGQQQEVKLSGDDNIVPLVKTEVHGEVLVVSLDEPVSMRKDLRLMFSVGDLKSLKCSGAVDVEATGIEATSLKADLSGASKLDIEGVCDVLTLELSGASEVDAKDLKSNKVHLRVSGASDVSVWASEELDVSASGASSVDYYGDPDKVVQDLSGASNLHKR